MTVFEFVKRKNMHKYDDFELDERFYSHGVSYDILDMIKKTLLRIGSDSVFSINSLNFNTTGGCIQEVYCGINAC